MKSNVCVIKKGGLGLETILAEVEKVTAYNGLPHKEALRLRLLAEELTGMLPELVKDFDGVFWMQNDGPAYELHVELSVEGMSREKKESLLTVAKSKKNAAATGFMGKIREIAQDMLLCSEDPGVSMASAAWQYSMDYGMDLHYTYAWTLDRYIEKCKETKCEADWDQLEKSIVAKLADDVLVGIRGKHVDIIIKKISSKNPSWQSMLTTCMTAADSKK